MKTCKNCSYQTMDTAHIFCNRCGTKFPVEAPKELYYSPRHHGLYSPHTEPAPGDVVKYVQAEEAETLRRMVKHQAETIKNLQEITNWVSAEDVLRRFDRKPRSFL